jgi:hypothetical protein
MSVAACTHPHPAAVWLLQSMLAFGHGRIIFSLASIATEQVS